MAEDIETKLRASAEEIIKNREDLRKKLFEIKDLLVKELERKNLSHWYHIFDRTPVEMVAGFELLSKEEQDDSDIKNLDVARRVAKEYKRYPTVNKMTLVSHYPLEGDIDQLKSGLILAQLYTLSANQISGEIEADGNIVQFRSKRYVIYLYDDSKQRGKGHRVELFKGASEDLLLEVAYNTNNRFEFEKYPIKPFVIDPIKPPSKAALQDIEKFLADLGYTEHRFKVHVTTLRKILQYASNLGAKVDGYNPNKPN